MASGSGNILPVEIFQLLESSDTSQNIREVILENLTSSKETWLIPHLVDYYFRTQSSNIMEILSGLREAHAKVLIEKLQDGVKTQDTRLPALQLVLQLVYKELPWCHQLLEMPFFSSIIKCLKSEHDVPILVTALMIVVILLPSAPVSMGKILPQIFEVFGRLTLFCVRKPANTPELFLLHLQVGLYSLFHRLYGMYPCSFLDYIGQFFSQKENLMAYHEVVMPMLERVRLHPNIIMSKGQNEMDTSRWKNQETQDIIVNCSKLSLDLIEGSVEESHCPVYQSIQEVISKSSVTTSVEERRGSKPIAVPVTSSTDTHSDSRYLMPGNEEAVVVGESPSVLIGLSTPPSSQRATPAISFLEPNGGTSGVTPDSASRQATPLCGGVDDGDRTPLSSNRSSVSHNLSKLSDSGKKQQQQQNPVVVTPKATATPHTTPVNTGGGGPLFSSPINPTQLGLAADFSSPLKSQSSAFMSPKQQQSRSPAMRSLQFSGGSEVGDSGDSPVSRSDKKEVRTSLDKQLQLNTADDCLKEKDRFTMENVAVRKLDTGDDNIDTAEDQEVEEINEREDQFNVEGSPTSSISTQASQTEVTAESVRQFMKKVNRIRFNSLTSNSSSEHDAHNKAAGVAGDFKRRRRPRSCPPLKRVAHRWSLEKKGWWWSKDEEFFGKGDKHDQQRSGQSHHRQQQHHNRRRSTKSWMKEDGDGAVEEEDDEDKTGEFSEESNDDFSSSSNSGSVPIPKITIGSSASDSKPKTAAGRHAVPTQNASTQVVPAFPAEINPAFQMLFAPSKVAVCSKCQHNLMLTSSHQSATSSPVDHDKMAAATMASTSTTTTTTTVTTDRNVTTIKGTEVTLFNALSPPELLDRHLKLGSELHAKELNKIPLTSKDTVNWTHFGGVPPADEVNILKGQILLMQAQLMYERHKRSNHAKRNRRLLRRIAHEAKLEEQQKTLSDEIRVLEQEVQQLRVSIKLVQEDNRKLRLGQESDQYSKLVQYKSSIQENKDLRASSIELKNLLLTQKEDYDKLQKKLEHVEHVNLEQDKDLKNCKGQLANTEKLKGQVFKLQKELLLMQELHLKYQEKLQHNLPPHHRRHEQDLLVSSLRQQLEELEKENRKKSTLLEAYQASAVENENMMKKKDNDILKLKHDLNKKRSEHVEQIKCLEERISSLIHTNQQLETRVVELTCKVDQHAHKATLQALKDNEARGKPAKGSTPKPSLENPARLMTTATEKDDNGNNNNESSDDCSMSRSGQDQRDDLEGKQDDGSTMMTKAEGKNQGVCLNAANTHTVKSTVGSGDGGGSTNVSVVVAKDEVSTEGSTFSQNDDSRNGNFCGSGSGGGGVGVGVGSGSSGGRHPAMLARCRAETDVYSDSGAASRSSFRVDSDASMRSVSEDSLNTTDSGCWNKT